MTQLNPEEFIISRKRKKYRFALFYNSPLCFEVDEWKNLPTATHLELGAGTGLFSVAQAEADPEGQYVAVDVKADRLQAGARKAEEKSLNNLQFLRARADQLTALLAPHCLKTIWITFPDPFPKTHDEKHRLTHPRFLDLYKELLDMSGALYLKTDATQFFEWTLEQLTEQGWKIEDISFDLHNSSLQESYKIQTTYESKYRNMSKKINFLKATLLV